MTPNFIFEKVSTLVTRLRELTDTPAGEISGITYVPCDYKSSNTPPSDGWTAFTPGTRVSGQDSHFWFRFSLHTPAALPGKDLYLSVTTGREGQWDALNPQGLVYLNGRMTQSLDTNHTRVLLPTDTDLEVLIYFYIGMGSWAVDFLPALIWTDTAIEGITYDLSVPLEACACLPPEHEGRLAMMRDLEEAANRLVMWPLYSEAFYEGIRSAGAYLADTLYASRREDGPVACCIGHTHIDVAWLWTLRQTCEKAQRSFATVIELMRRYPEYKFMSSQPQLYKYVKENAPELYEEIRARVAEGRWEAEGAMWLEADSNLISGESMVRQIVHGKRFMQKEFGVESRTLWLPDVFGYSAATPQIMKKCGVDNFVTSKISWNETNLLPCDTFIWQGIDGTEVFCNFLTAQNLPADGKPVNFSTYNADITPAMALGTWNRYQQKDCNDHVAITFGFGDGGGGPTREMLERQRRLAKGLPGVPRTEMSTSAEWLAKAKENFDAAVKRSGRTPRWVGELYLELHRGTYTSIAKNKRNNRKTEFLLQKAEGLSAAAGLLTGRAYPAEKLYQAWETVCKNQFHDIIPGSSIFEVYENCDREYAALRETGNGICEEAMAALAGSVATEGGLFVYNPLGMARNAAVKWDGETVETGLLPAFGWKVLKKAPPARRVHAEEALLENDLYRMELDAAGRISRLYDKKAERDVFLPGALGNELQLSEDYPKCYDAWEITNYYKQKTRILDSEAVCVPVCDGARAGIRVEKTYLNSRIVQTIWMYDTLPRIDFETEIDWQEEHQLLKAAFPFDVHANQATYEIQFGNLERPTHANTSYDAAKFEVCAHKWADLSEDGYGVSLLNDCKYGHSAEGSTLKLTLLKCATYPNPQADKGRHEFTYSLLPHVGDYRSAGTVREAYSLNQPVCAVPVPAQKGSLPERFSLFSCDAENVVIETVKQAYDGSGTVVRLYDAFDRRGTVTLKSGVPFRSAALCDMLEREQAELPVNADGSVTLKLKNFEILTLKLR